MPANSGLNHLPGVEPLDLGQREVVDEPVLARLSAIRRVGDARSGNTSATLVVRSSVSSWRQISTLSFGDAEVRLDEVGLLLHREL